MNCNRFHDLVFEYLDGSLSGPDRAAAEAHMAGCAACRQAASEQRRIASTLADGLRQRVEGLSLSPEAQRRIRAALARPSRTVPRESPFKVWLEQALWPVAVAASLLVAASLMTGLPFRPATHPGGMEGTALLPVMVSVRISSCDETYVFRWEGNRVLDTITCAPRLVQETIWPSRSQPPAPQGHSQPSTL
jgi:anti-sigma factor RsiW